MAQLEDVVKNKKRNQINNKNEWSDLGAYTPEEEKGGGGLTIFPTTTQRMRPATPHG